jgi:hypothetical protein
MDTSAHSEDESEPHREAVTAKEAKHRIAALRRAYDEGYISGTTLDTITRTIRRHAKRNR